MRIVPITSINKYIRENEKAFIESCEEEYHYQVSDAADGIIKSIDEKPILLISGPSGSGKTVTAHRIKDILEEKGHKTHLVSMDNYFLPLDDDRNRMDEFGRVDLESPKRLNAELLNEQIHKISNCEEVVIPKFDFKNQTSEPGYALKRERSDIVIMEGIHALNPEVTGSVLDRAKTLYVSVRTRIESADHSLLHPSRIRLMRRLVRDKMFRGREFADTLEYFENVERGELLYIIPFKDNVDFDIDTFIPYEPSVYKKYIYDELRFLRIKAPERYKLHELLMYISELDELEISAVPENSLVREFAGGNILMHS